MRHALAFFTPLAGCLVAIGCTTNVMVGSDGSTGGHGGHGTTSSSTTSSGMTGGSSSGTTGGSSSGTTSGSSSSSSSGITGGSCWDGSPVSVQGGPCGGNLWSDPPTCSPGLTCHQDTPDAVGTCAPSATPVSGEGGKCGGFIMNPAICSWDTTCQPSGVPDAPGTCVLRSCAGGSGSGCTSPIVTVVGDGPAKQFDFICQGAQAGSNPSAATGYIGYPAPMPGQPEHTWIKGCATAGADPLAGSLYLDASIATVGASSQVKVAYDSGVDQFAGTASIQITELDADTIAGSYTASVQAVNSNQTQAISGIFKVCRSPDFLPP